MKFKNLSKEQLLISFDRLTRFKNTKDKYFRVFTNIITSNIIEPIYKKQELLSIPANEIRKIAEEIINSSLSDLSDSKKTDSKKINEILKDYENSVFKNDDETQEYLNNNINLIYLFRLLMNLVR